MDTEQEEFRRFEMVVIDGFLNRSRIVGKVFEFPSRHSQFFTVPSVHASSHFHPTGHVRFGRFLGGVG